MSESLFRAAALKRLNTLDDLDRLVGVTKPVGWLAGAALGVIIVAVLVWSVLGELPSRVVGSGLVLRQGGRVVELQSRGAGLLAELPVVVGDTVKAGQVVARLGDTDSERELASLRQQLADLQRTDADAADTEERQAKSRAESVLRQQAAIGLRVRNAQAQQAVLAERVATNDALYRERYIQRQQVIQTQNDLAAARQELSNAASDLAQLQANELDAARLVDERVRDRRRMLDDLQRRIATLNGNLDSQLTVRSPDFGTVVEVRSQPGALVHQGQPLIALEQNGTGFEVVSFVGAQDGKRVRPGMEVRIALASARREEFGMLLGRVVSVSEFPLSLDAVRAVIQNDELARSFGKDGPAFMVRLRLDLDPASVSGYRWTSRRGDETALSSGILTSVEIVTRQRRPIALAIPALRQLLAL